MSTNEKWVAGDRNGWGYVETDARPSVWGQALNDHRAWMSQFDWDAQARWLRLRNTPFADYGFCWMEAAG